MVLERKQVGVGLEAHGAVVDADGVGVLVVEEGASMTVGAAALFTSLFSTNQTVQTSEKSEFRHAYGPEEAGLEIIYLVVPAAVPGQTGAALEALPAAGAAEAGVALLVDPLVVAEEASQTEGLAAGVADVALLLGVDAHVVAQGHVVGVGLVTEGAAEVASLVSVLVVEQAAGMLVGATA